MSKGDLIRYKNSGLIKRVEKSLITTKNLLGLNLPPLYAIHFDDHSILLNGLKNGINKYLPTLKIDGFQKSDMVFQKMKQCFSDNIRVDLIITGMNQGRDIDGYSFAKSVREIETPYNLKTPVILYTMYEYDFPLIGKGIMENIFDKYFDLTVGPMEIAEYIKSIYALK